MAIQESLLKVRNCKYIIKIDPKDYATTDCPGVNQTQKENTQYIDSQQDSWARHNCCHDLIPQSLKRKQTWLQCFVVYEEYINEAKTTLLALLEKAPNLCNAISTAPQLSFTYATPASPFWINLLILFIISCIASKIGKFAISVFIQHYFFFYAV